jgi:hypothetical protein
MTIAELHGCKAHGKQDALTTKTEPVKYHSKMTLRHTPHRADNGTGIALPLQAATVKGCFE